MSDYPALTGDVVTESHTTICAQRGHATHTVAGADSGVCPRCGAVTTAAGVQETILASDELTNEARGWAMDAYDMDSMPSAARALELIRVGYDGGAAEFIRNSSPIISN